MAFNKVLYKKISLTSSEILSLNSTSQELVSAPGSGKLVEPMSAVGFLNFNSAAYATNTKLQIVAASIGNAILEETDLLLATSNEYRNFGRLSDQLAANDAIDIQVASGDPGSGDSPMDIYLFYRIIDVS